MPRDQLAPRRTVTLALRTAAAAAALALCACEKIDYLPPNPVAPWPTKVLLHRGGGDPSPHHPNTLDAVLYGAPLLDGVEVDVQISASGTLWLGHDNAVLDCQGGGVGECFQDLDDAAIAPHATCTDPGSGAAVQHYSRLDDVFAAVALAYPDKLYSLDIKGQLCGLGIAGRARDMADEVDRLVRLHGLDGKVAVETSQREFLQRIVDRGTPVYSFVVALDDIDGPLGAAANLGATGISLKWDQTADPLTASAVAGIHGVGYRVIAWTINAPEDIAAVWAMQPDVIETDKAYFMDCVADPTTCLPP